MTCSIESLPPELQLQLIRCLDWPALTALRQASLRFYTLLPLEKLRHEHIARAADVKDQETATLKRLEQDYWEQAEQSFLGYHNSSYTSSSLDPDLRADSERITCAYSTLPCYRCLQWLPSLTDDASFESRCAFSRGMCTGNRNLGAKLASSRICIPCGIRKGQYRRGSRVKNSAICLSCGKLADPPDTFAWSWGDPRMTWKLKVYCRGCLVLPAVVELTIEQFEHEKKWSRYERGMLASKQARLEKGRLLREEAGIVLRQLALSMKDSNAVPEPTCGKKRFCPIMKEMRLCRCSMLLSSA